MLKNATRQNINCCNQHFRQEATKDEVENILIIHIATSQLKYFIQVTIKLVKQIIIYCHNSNAYYTVKLCKSIGTPRQHPV